MIHTQPQKRKRDVKRLISSIDAEISNMQQQINTIPKGDPCDVRSDSPSTKIAKAKRIQLLDRIAEQTVALGLLQDELRTLVKIKALR